MNKNKTIVFLLLATVGILAAMGCWFCWHCPSRVYGAHEMFWRQLAWNGIGFAVFAGAVMLGWRRWLRSAPWLMALWCMAIVAAQGFCAVRGTHRWIVLGPFRVNVATCLVPVFALFAAWVRGRKWRRPWMEWTFFALAAVAVGCMVAFNPAHMKRLAAYFSPDDYIGGEAYMSCQLQQALAAASWFGDAGKNLGFLPCPESDGMMSASALLFGKWFPVAVVFLFATLGACLSVVWKGEAEASRRRYVLFFGLWLVVPAAYCLLHSLSLLPVAGMSPALAGYGGTAVVMAWWGMGVLVAMAREETPESVPDVGTGGGSGSGWKSALCIGAIWMGVVALLVALLVVRCHVARSDGTREFAEPRPPDLEFGEFGLVAKRGRIYAADGSLLAYTVRTWRYYLDPIAVSQRATGKRCRSIPCCCPEIAQGLRIPEDELKAAYMRKGSRYVFLKEVEDGSVEAAYFERNQSLLTRAAGLIREPVQKRVYPLGSAAVSVVGFMIGGSHADAPRGAGGIESSCNRVLAGDNGVYDKKLPRKERYERAIPKPGTDIRTTLVPELQKTVSDALAAACATNGAESAWGIVMKIPSGEIEAMASWPSFDPGAHRDLDMWSSSMAVNRAAQNVFEPGGLAKPLTYAIALDAGALSEDAKIDQEGGIWEYNGVTLKDEATNALSIAEAIECHANIAAGKTACLIGPEKFHAALQRFGFGTKTCTVGIPGESFGLLNSRPECWKTDKTTAMRVGMGYGFAATGLQIAQAYATLGNHGTLVRPVLVRGEGGATNTTRQVLSASAADAIVRMLKSPMPSTVQMYETDISCKAYSPTNYIASCAGFHPAEKPQRVIVVSFAKPHPIHAGDDVAVPVFRAIERRIP